MIKPVKNFQTCRVKYDQITFITLLSISSENNIILPNIIQKKRTNASTQKFVKRSQTVKTFRLKFKNPYKTNINYVLVYYFFMENNIIYQYKGNKM